MIDFREKVKEDRGLLKKLELSIPGFRGYRKREDLRIADSLLRKQLADNIKNIETKFNECREIFVQNMEVEYLEETGVITNLLNEMEGKIRHAEQGYTGISSDYRISVNELNRMYEWDVSLLSHIDNIKGSCEKLLHKLQSNQNDGLNQDFHYLKQNIGKFKELYEKRKYAFAQLGVEL